MEYSPDWEKNSQEKQKSQGYRTQAGCCRLGKIGEFKSRMMLMAAKEGFHEAKTVVWLSDGGKGYWGVFNEIFSGKAHGVLDFYHAVQNVWKGAKAWLDGRTNRARKWFAEARRKIRKGKVLQTLKDLKEKSLLAEICR